METHDTTARFLPVRDSQVLLRNTETAWRGCLRGQLAACSTPRRWTRLLAQTPRFVDGRGCGPRSRLVFVPSCAARARVVTRRTSRPPTEHSLCTLPTWRGCLRGQLVTRCTLRRSPTLFSIDTALFRRLQFSTAVAFAF